MLTSLLEPALASDLALDSSSSSIDLIYSSAASSAVCGAFPLARGRVCVEFTLDAGTAGVTGVLRVVTMADRRNEC